MRIAFFGGSFDPPHRGHLAIAEAAAQRLRLDQVLFAPVGRQPLKHAASRASASSFEDRCAMVELAIAQGPAMTLSRIDAPKPNGEPNYTIDTLRQLRATLAPADELFCLIGADSFLTLRQWRSATELLLTCNFIVATRPGFAVSDLSAALPDSLALSMTHTQTGQPGACELFQASEQSSSENSIREASIYLLPDLDEDISATRIRAALATRTMAEKLLPSSVVTYIKTHNLYRQTSPISRKISTAT